MAPNIVHNESANRYELRVGEQVASIAEYRRQGDRLIFDHTQTDRRFRGQGRAAELVKAALDDVRSRGLSVVPQCWFVADFVRDHPEYEDLVA
jgi:predicted GNAT family acetyltransferase